MKDKKAFVLYADLIHTVELMSDQKAGKLFKIVLDYVNDKNPEVTGETMKVAFEPIKRQLKRDLVKYEGRCKKNSENIRKRWDKKDTIEYERKQSNTKNTDKDTDTDKDKDIYRAFNHLSITKEKHEELVKKFPKIDIDGVYDNIENSADNKKYTNLYLTANNWAKKDYAPMKKVPAYSDPTPIYFDPYPGRE
jgi:hypothetical protein